MPTKRNRTPLFVGRSREMRHQLNDAEAMVWNAVRDRKLGNFKFRRQYSLGNYIADFYCAEARVIVELDGETHVGKEEYDATREDWMTSQGICVMRFQNDDVYDSLEELLEVLWRKCVERTTAAQAPHPNPLPGVPRRGN
ncbi:endonuclease domain-containing protein [Anatilimnocola sp. NA78]|uniref:endonuclease domain-containing protein n=1 Tax=Anatilimnocola sp. NA78 TaxID=3415683 RepID=UPI003CE535D0